LLASSLVLRKLAELEDGIDYLQVFEDDTKSKNLWFIDDGDGDAITGLLPSEYEQGSLATRAGSAVQSVGSVQISTSQQHP
jgi:hypothetical protein